MRSQKPSSEKRITSNSRKSLRSIPLEPLDLTSGAEDLDHKLLCKIVAANTSLTLDQRMQLLVIISVDEYGQTINDAKVSALKASVGSLNSTIDEQRKLLVEVEDICGRDGHGGQIEDGKSSLIDRIRAHLRKLDLSLVNKKTKEVYRIGAPYSASAEIVVYGDPEIASYAWRIETLGKVTKDSKRKAYGCAEIALRDALIASSD